MLTFSSTIWDWYFMKCITNYLQQIDIGFSSKFDRNKPFWNILCMTLEPPFPVKFAPRGQPKISISFQPPPQRPLDSPEIQATFTLWTLTFVTLDIYTVNIWTLKKKSASASSFHHQAAAPNQHQLPGSTTRQQHQTSISFQAPPPGSSTTPASLQQGTQPISC